MKHPIAKIYTDHGVITMELYPEHAPNTVNAFLWAVSENMSVSLLPAEKPGANPGWPPSCGHSSKAEHTGGCRGSWFKSRCLHSTHRAVAWHENISPISLRPSDHPGASLQG